MLEGWPEMLTGSVKPGLWDGKMEGEYCEMQVVYLSELRKDGLLSKGSDMDRGTVHMDSYMGIDGLCSPYLDQERRENA